MSNRRLVTIGALLGVFLAGIEGTVVSTAMPTIVKSLGGLSLYSWVFAAYMLFSAITMPIFGKLSDAYGRKKLFFFGVSTFVLGSVLSGFSQNMIQLVFFRTIQGVGGGAMHAIPYTILGVVYSPEERGKAIGWGAAVWGISSVVGPLLGFAIVDTLGWRWVFFVSVPVGFAAITLVGMSLEETTGSAERNIDYVGSGLLAIGVGGLLLGLQFAEQSAVNLRVTGLVGIGAIGLVGFYFVEKRVREPILPPHYFRDRVFLLTNGVAFLSSFVIFAAIAYVPLFVQSARGGVDSAALALFPITIAWSGASLLAGNVVQQVGERRLVILGSFIFTTGFVGATFWGVDTPMLGIMANMFVLGVGIGLTSIPLLTLIQNRFGTEEMGTATSSQQFFRNLGGTVGITLLGLLMTGMMRRQLEAIPGVSTLGDLQQALLESTTPSIELLPIMARGLHWVFIVAVAISVITIIMGVFLPSSSLGDEELRAHADD